MALIKKFLALPIVKFLVSPKIIKVIIFVLLVFVTPLVLLIRWRRSKKKKAAGAGEPEKKKLAPKDLVKIWKAFRRQIPAEFRWTISHYQNFVVLGEAGSGKSQLIDNCTDWQGHAHQFYPSYTADPTLQLYLGPQKLVQEIPSPLLRDSSPGSRKAFINLWSRVFGKKDPVIICVLKASALTSMTHESLRKQAQMMRGKINVISRLRKKPVKIHIVLTHMDQMEGYQELASFLQKNHIPFKIDLEENSTKEDLKNCLAPYEKYLPLALTTLNSGDYTKIMKFFTEAPDSFSALYMFLHTLKDQDPLSLTPALKDVFLTSSTVKAEESNPFNCQTSLPAHVQAKSIRKYKYACLSLALLGSFYFWFGYFYEQRKLEQHLTKTRETLKLYEQSPQPSPLLKLQAQKEIDRISQLEEFHPLLRVVPSFFDGWEKIQQNFQKKLATLDRSISGKKTAQLKNLVEKIREEILLPALQKARRSSRPQKRILYLLSLLYSSQKNDLGKYIRQNLLSWTKNLAIPKQVIENYIRYSSTSWAGSIDLSELQPLSKNLSTAQNLQNWLVYLIDMEKTSSKSFLFPRDLAEQQEKAKNFQEIMEQVEQHHSLKTIFKLLKKEVNLNLERVYKPLLTNERVTDWIMENHSNLKELFAMVRQQKIRIPKIKKTNLQALLNYLQAISLLDKTNSATFEVTLSPRKFIFSKQKWVDLIHRSNVRFLIRKFISYHQNNQKNIFFADREDFSDLTMNPENYGSMLFSGQGKIPGRYTQLAFSKKIKPVVEDLYSLLKDFPINPEDKKMLENFVFQQVDHYANIYWKYSWKYYKRFAVRADSVGALRIILTQMAQPSSPFNDFLISMQENTALEKSSCPLLRPIYKNLENFQYINRLLSEKKGVELDNYRAFLKQMRLELEGGSPKEKGKDKKDEKKAGPKINPFEDILSPEGKMTYLIFIGSPRSYMAQVQQWLKSVGIQGDWQKPFLEPIYQLYNLGLEDLEKNVHQSWKNVLWPQLSPILSKYPFNSKSKKPVTPLQLEQVLHPQSSFWLSFRQLIGPVCAERNGIWKQRIPSLNGNIRLPQKMLRIINHLSQLSRILWDKEGNNTPLLFYCKALPLPNYRVEKKALTLAFLSCGKSAIYSFNQKPSWQKFKIKWWKEETSKIAIQMGSIERDKKSYKDLSISDKLWSFYRLLQKAEVLRKNTWTWGMRIAYPSGTFKIRFSFQKNPWNLFLIPGVNTAERKEKTKETKEQKNKKGKSAK